MGRWCNGISNLHATAKRSVHAWRCHGITKQYPEACQVGGPLLLRIDAPLLPLGTQLPGASGSRGYKGLRPSTLLVHRNVKQYPEARQVEGLLLLRIDAPLFFANVNPVKEALTKYEARAAEAAAARGRPLQFIVIDLSPVTDIDASAVHFLTVRAP